MTEAQQQQRYRVLERLASGGMAEVFLAESAGIEGFKKNVAIKRVLPHLGEKKRFISMFLDEARLSAYLTHSNVAQVFDIGVGDNAYFIVMEYVDGADLKAVIEHQRKIGKALPVEAACLIAIKICEGLAYAHELKNNEGQPLRIVHRDMSPPNVLITKHGEVKIVDFGLAKASSQLEKSEAGIIKGKFSYLSPEAALGQEVDHRTDIFAVGIILWEMLAGRRLFLGDTDFQTVKQVQQAVIPPLSQLNKDVPIALERILARALARDPATRYGSARDLGRDLTEFLYKLGRPVSAFDIAEFVLRAMAQRTKAKPDKGSIIDKLIEEALFEFTSLQDDKAAPLAPKGDQPLALGDFVKLDTFADSLADDIGASLPPARPSASASVPEGELGNLAALEEDDEPLAPSSDRADVLPETPEPPTAAIAPARSMSVAPSAQVSAFAAKAPDSAAVPAPASGGGGAVKGLLVVVILAALAAGAYFGGIIPH
jgi:serine/threonine-protein kinase